MLEPEKKDWTFMNRFVCEGKPLLKHVNFGGEQLQMFGDVAKKYLKNEKMVHFIQSHRKKRLNLPLRSMLCGSGLMCLILSPAPSNEYNHDV